MSHASFLNQNKEENITKVRDTWRENSTERAATLIGWKYLRFNNIYATLSFDYMAGCDNW